MLLTKNVRLEEFRVSRQHPAIANLIEFTKEDELKAYYLAAQFLQPVRDVFGAVTITSGKRSEDLNRLIGGSVNSDHLFTQGTSKAAVDFTCRATMEDVYELLKPRRCYGQLILYRRSNFVHVSMPTPQHVGEAWTWDK